MASLIRDRAAASAEMIATFGDETLIAAALRFEAALARAAAAEGLIPAAAATVIATTCAEARFDLASLAEEAARAGTLAIPLVKRLRDLVAARDESAAAFVHFGATSQDLADTVLMLQAKAGADLVRREAVILKEALANLAATHAETPMLGRTLLQSALPITLGLKAANWLLGVDAGLRRFAREADEALACQLGGPVGTLAGLNPAVAARLAEELGLAAPPLSWHARRDAMAGLCAALAILTGAVGKIARDISLLAQGEVGEAREPLMAGRGGSSAMAHKRNPTGCQVAISAALRAPALASAVMSGLPQEHERGLGGWQAEGPQLATLFELTHGALSAMAPVIVGLEIDAEALGANLAAANVGDDIGHAVGLTRAAIAHSRRES
jgi:3-carboxy-cis,cis-muconate cycloisomerase